MSLPLLVVDSPRSQKSPSSASSTSAHDATSPNSARLATSIQTALNQNFGKSLDTLHSPHSKKSLKPSSRANPIHQTSSAILVSPTPPPHPREKSEEKEKDKGSSVALATLAPKVQLAKAFSSGKPVVEVVDQKRRTTFHHLPPMTDNEKKILFDALPSLRQLDEIPAHSAELRSASLSIIRQWLQDKLATSKWLSLIQSIRVMAEGSEHTHLHENQHTLLAMGLDANSLHAAGIPAPLVSRIYKALWVYSLGIHELITEVAHHANNNHVVIGNVWKCYAILLEDYQGEDYVMALMQVEAESQRVLKQMEERFGKSLQMKQENEVKTQSEVKTLGALLERSQVEARALLEKKDSLAHEILHLETLNADLEAMNAEAKKELWFTSNQLNRMNGKYDQLLKSSKLTEEKLLQDIHELKLEQEEVKASLDQELSTNERLSYKVDRFTGTIADLTANITRLKNDLSEKVQENNLMNKVLEKTTLDLSNLEREKAGMEVDYKAKLVEAAERQKELEARIRNMEDMERGRLEREVEERQRQEMLARAAAKNANNDSVASSPLVLDLRAQLATARAAHEKEMLELNGRNTILTERIRALQRRVKKLGGESRFVNKNKDDDYLEDADNFNDSDHSDSPGRSPHKKGRSRDDDDSSGSSAGNSRASSIVRRRRSKKKGQTPTSRGGSSSPEPLTYQLPGTMQSVARELSVIQKELESKEKLNTNLLMSVNKLKVNLTQSKEEVNRKESAIEQLKSDLSAMKDTLSTERQSRQEYQAKSGEQAIELERVRKFEGLCTEQAKTIQDLQKQKIQFLHDKTELSSGLTEKSKELKASQKELKASKANVKELQQEVKDLQTECDNRSKNQNELGLRIRTLNSEVQSLQSINDEIQRNIKSSADTSSLLGSLEAKGHEINRLFLKIRDMEHARIELMQSHETKLLEVRKHAKDEAAKKAEDAVAVEVARAKKLRAQMTEQKTEHAALLDSVKKEYERKLKELADSTAQQQLSKRNDELQQSLNTAQKTIQELQAAISAAQQQANDGEPAASIIPPAALAAAIDSGLSSALTRVSASVSDLSIQDLTNLLNGSTPVTCDNVINTLSSMAAQYRSQSDQLQESKELRTQLEELNFKYKNEIAVLLEQMESVKVKYKEFAMRDADPAASLGATGTAASGGGGGGGVGSRKRRGGKKSQADLKPSDDVTAQNQAQSSSDDEDVKKGVRFTRDALRNSNLAIAGKRGSIGRLSVNLSSDAPPPLNRSQSQSKIKFSDGKQNDKEKEDNLPSPRRSTMSKSPRSTLFSFPNSIPVPNSQTSSSLKRSSTVDQGDFSPQPPASPNNASLATGSAVVVVTNADGEDSGAKPRPAILRRQGSMPVNSSSSVAAAKAALNASTSDSSKRKGGKAKTKGADNKDSPIRIEVANATEPSAVPMPDLEVSAALSSADEDPAAKTISSPRRASVPLVQPIVSGDVISSRRQSAELGNGTARSARQSKEKKPPAVTAAPVAVQMQFSGKGNELKVASSVVDTSQAQGMRKSDGKPPLPPSPANPPAPGRSAVPPTPPVNVNTGAPSAALAALQQLKAKVDLQQKPRP